MQKPPSPLYFETKDLYTRAFQHNDVGDLENIINNPYFHYRYFHEGGTAKDFITNAIIGAQSEELANDVHRVAICKKETNQLIGSYALFYARKNYMNIINEYVYEMGLFLDYDHWGQGYGGQITPFRIQAGFEMFKCDALHVTVHPDNKASRAIQEKMGFKKIATGNLFPKTNQPINDRLVFKLCYQDWCFKKKAT